MIKVISGGQTGADIAALRVAKECGLETGGWMPKGFKTLAGPRPEYAELYGLRENDSTSYRDRTFDNVCDSDATLRLAHDFSSPGERCTLKAIFEYGRPSMDIAFVWNAGLPSTLVTDTATLEVKQWIRDTNIQILNVAGNAGEWFESIVENYLRKVFGPIMLPI
jgi:hypothetical protein